MPTAVVLPGRGYGHDLPALFLARQAIADRGLEVVRVEWPAAGMPHDEDEAVAAVCTELASAIEAHGPPAYVVAKSLGTLAAPVAAARGLPAVWLTPLVGVAACAAGIADNPAAQLLVGGTADELWDTTVVEQLRAPMRTVVELEGADHGFVVPGDAVATAEAHVALTRSIVGFVGR